MDKITLVLLAAGSSRRFQGNKLLHRLDGKPMYQYLADEVDRLPRDAFAKRIVVTQYEEIGKNLGERGYQVVTNYESELGISHSVKLAVHTVRESGALCFAVCDQPYLKAATIEKLICGWRASQKGIGCLGYRGELGNPAIFSERYYKELLALEGDVGGRRVIRHHLEDLYVHEAEDSKELTDIDGVEYHG